MWNHVRLVRAMIVSLALMLGAETAGAAPTPEERCYGGRYKAAGAYVACQHKILTRIFAGHEAQAQQFSKCRTKYVAAWLKLQADAFGTGSPCDTPRFENLGDGTVIDHLTGLQWERKTDDAGIHDKDNEYTWSDPGNGDSSDADGTVFTSFLPTLNASGSCLGGHCDWRLPTLIELQTLLAEPYPCSFSPCIDEGIFGPSATILSTASTSLEFTAGLGVWQVVFFSGGLPQTGAGKAGLHFFRAVRSTF